MTYWDRLIGESLGEREPHYYYYAGWKYDEDGNPCGRDDRWKDPPAWEDEPFPSFNEQGISLSDDTDDIKYEAWLRKNDKEQLVTQTAENKFPYTLADLQGWIVTRKDGTVTRFNLVDRMSGGVQKAGVVTPYTPATRSVSEWCNHYPAVLPVFEGKVGSKEIRLHIADAPGAIRDGRKFDYIIDGGHVINLGTIGSGSILDSNDQNLVKGLDQYTLGMVKVPKVLKIDWQDRRAPECTPKFWEVLLKKLEGSVLTCCQGGHGRSGSALVILMMFMTDYSPLDAITHLRAVHCPRAIESIIQHEYLNEIAKYLGREQNALEAEEVKDFRARFLTMTTPISRPYQDRLMAKGSTR